MNGLFPSHFALLEDKVAESYFDAIAISGTKIVPRSNDSHLALDGFNLFYIDREGMGGGGVDLYVRDSYSIEILSASDPVFDNAAEFIICEIRKDQLRHASTCFLPYSFFRLPCYPPCSLLLCCHYK